MFSKKGLAFGSLMLYIAIIIVAAAAVTVIINATTGMQTKMTRVASESQKQTSFMIDMLDITGYGAEDLSIDVFTIRMKLYSGATPINLYNTLISIMTEFDAIDAVSGQRILDLSSSWIALDKHYVDFNLDDLVDYIRLLNDTHVQFNVSNSYAGYSLCNVSLTFAENTDLSAASASVPVELVTRQAQICPTQVGTLDVVGTTTSSSTMTNDLFVIVGDGDTIHAGAFSTEFIELGPYHEDGLLNEGDIVQLTIVPHRSFSDNDGFIFKFVPVYGVALNYNVETPSVIPTDRVSLVWG
jgi:archaellin